MNRTLVIGDIHGALKALKEILEKAKVTKDDKLIFLGDYVDAWSDSAKTLDFLISLQQSHNCIMLKGNHDELLLDWLIHQNQNEKWLMHGGQSTLEAYKNMNKTHRKIHQKFIENLPTYHVDNQNRLFVHAGFANMHGPDYEYYENTVYWDRTLWETAVATDNKLNQDDVKYPKRLKLFKEIYIGHTPVSRYGQLTPMQAQNVINVDTAAAFKGPLTILDVDTKNYWQSTPVHELYPDENGRN
ncbi:metallophosphoesterase family protein [Flavobacteriaceae bacterium 14752]|uniref:metallophosphoesterase family protein n=1 Tax=Mesohalobacter salilacus TaxID=2491711 RepID=UPI000F635F7C|nr:serine/threonine protein phosphatase [Flavobacteriaceae bacterium 14752]